MFDFFKSIFGRKADTAKIADSRKKFLICVDSDGCVMDTMTVKHEKCFGPCMVELWQLDQWRDEILKSWDHVNLYSMTRGINRFKGLALALREIDGKYKAIPGVETLEKWVAASPALSNGALESAIADCKDAEGKSCLEMALQWSVNVNKSIDALPEEEKLPFEGALEGLIAAHEVADIAVVSSANRKAVEDEWGKHGLLEHTDYVMCQDNGSKADCIRQMIEKGYVPKNIMMVGDAPGDLDAAKKNGVWFFPILVGHEAVSWTNLRVEGLIALKYGFEDDEGEEEEGNYQEMLIDEFMENLR